MSKYLRLAFTFSSSSSLLSLHARVLVPRDLAAQRRRRGGLGRRDGVERRFGKQDVVALARESRRQAAFGGLVRRGRRRGRRRWGGCPARHAPRQRHARHGSARRRAAVLPARFLALLALPSRRGQALRRRGVVGPGRRRRRLGQRPQLKMRHSHNFVVGLGLPRLRRVRAPGVVVGCVQGDTGLEVVYAFGGHARGGALVEGVDGHCCCPRQCFLGCPGGRLGVPGTFALVLRSCWSLSRPADPPPVLATGVVPGRRRMPSESSTRAPRRRKTGFQPLEVFAEAARV